MLFYWLTNVRESDYVLGVSSDLSGGLVMGFAIGVMLVTLSTLKLNKYWVFFGNKRLNRFDSSLPNNVIVANYFMSSFLDTTHLPCLLKSSNLGVMPRLKLNQKQYDVFFLWLMIIIMNNHVLL